MTRPEHTPGPWRVRAQSGEIEIVADPEGRFSPECLVRIKGQRNAAANAALIAAAPDLLEALERLCRVMAVGSAGRNDREKGAAWEYAQAAIRRAKAVNTNCLEGIRCPI